jgi:hypothetical protein
MLIQGYHPGLEDDAFYLAAIKHNLNPSLFPHDADFFRLQFQATIFDKVIAYSIRLTHLPIDWAVLLWQFAATLLILWGCLSIARLCFRSAHAQWAAVMLVAVLLTIPVSGTAVSLTDQYLHPRALATAAILGAIVATLKERWRTAAVLLAAAFLTHAIMASFGLSFCIFLAWKPSRTQLQMATLLLPLGWLFEPASDAWRQAASTRQFYYLNRWSWYEWLGVIAPLVLLWWFSRIAQRKELPVLARLASRLVYFGLFQMVVGLVIMLPQQFERLRPFEPMRYLQLVYLLFFLIAGGLLGECVLGKHTYRWVLLFLPLGLGMFYAQRQMYPATTHLELPGTRSNNPWLEAFAWIRQHTPTDSLFALDPYYMELPREDFHGFRALAERSVLADYVKDGGMAARVPRLAPRWQREVEAQTGWKNFQAADFHRLRNSFGVNWVVLAQPPVAGMTCPYQNQGISVCRLE